MLATIPEFREVDFSHLTLTTDSALESVEPARNPQSSLLWVALLLSLLLHLSFLLFNFNDEQFLPKPVPAQTLRIDLVQLPIKKLDTVPEIVMEEINELQVAPEVEKEVIASPVPATEITPTEKPREGQSAARLIIEPLTSQELAEIVDSHNVQSNSQATAPIAENVFHPGLRARLSEEANKPKLARIEDSILQTFTDPAGATIVKSPGGCMRSPADTKIGAPRNWYFVACGGKSESEKMMERVNEDVNGKLRFDE
ncbi:MAG: hypothetical protein Q7T48_06585 [Cellvibrio sp.]|uniref:hypothetical protein n=1 Tax=Cellvibrio sp. TaxID=1965322 RepID=UPI00271F7A4D|nr:hypothetical protein [Cellvibrio sp.]